MSLPKRLYDLYRQISQCPLVQTGEVTDETLEEFQNLLNEAQPQMDNPEEHAYRSLTKSMYHSNPVGFIKYISVSRNRVSALILWTESKRIVRFFSLQGRVHLSWDPTTQNYIASHHVHQPDNFGRNRGRGRSFRSRDHGRGGRNRARVNVSPDPFLDVNPFEDAPEEKESSPSKEKNQPATKNSANNQPSQSLSTANDPTNNLANDPTNNLANDPTNNLANNLANDPTNDPNVNEDIVVETTQQPKAQLKASLFPVGKSWADIMADDADDD